jgi:hypothetical protein
MNEFKFSALRQFGSENVSFTATVHSEKNVLSEEEIQAQINQISTSINKAFIACQEREISEKDLLAAAADRRRVAIGKLDQALKDEMVEKVKAEGTMKEAEKLSKKLNNK